MNENDQPRNDISIIVTAHAEGRLAHRTMRSLQAAIREAYIDGLRSEIIVVLDNPSAETLAYFIAWREHARIIEVNTGDPGLNRNTAVTMARGKYIAMLNADDCFGRNWLRLAFRESQKQSGTMFAIHPEFAITFGTINAISEHPDSSILQRHPSKALERNYWTSMLFTPRGTLLKLPFAATLLDSGFGYEDWHWYCNLLAANGAIKIAAETCVFVRRKSVGFRTAMHDQNQALLRPTNLLEPSSMQNNLLCSVTESPKEPHLLQKTTWSDRKKKLSEFIHALPQHISRVTAAYPMIHRVLGAIYRLGAGDEKGILRSSLPVSLLDQWRAISEIEPQLFPSDKYLEKVHRVSYPPDETSEVYATICRMLCDDHGDMPNPRFTHVFLVPWLKKGGSDLETINYIILTATDPNHRVLVIATENTDSPWKSRLPSSVHFINIGAAIQRLRSPKRIHVFACLLVQLKPHVIHLINSALGNQVFVKYGKAISHISRLYATVFCTDFELDGTTTGYCVTALPEYEEFLTTITSDNRRICEYLTDTFAIDPAKMVVHYQPVMMRTMPNRIYQPTGTINVLWAGRLDHQKRPDLVVEIARRCQAEKIHFHVYGSPVLVGHQSRVDFENCPNVTYHGPFDRLSTLPVSEYDFFLNTSQWDGMPNILLEAIAAGLPIISSDVGGIGELIVQDETGLLVSPFDDVEQYVQAIRRLIANPDLGVRLLMASRQLVAQRHSWEHFAADINSLPGYLESPCRLENAELALLECADSMMISNDIP